ncbi:uncharacterized protein LOC144903812, partial [Branchiostoma floridae x Branchiostoma belcheri]
PGKRWGSAFRRRHPEISLRSPDSLDRARAAMSNARVVEKHFKQLGGRDHITVMSCVSSAGAVVPPMIIFNRAMPSGKFSEGGPPGAMYAWSESGFINKELFEDWFFKVFLVHCHRERPILLVVDQHSSHLSLKVLKTAMEQKIIIYGLPPHTSHFTQPLDVTVFSSLKTKWATTLESLQAADTRFQVRKTTFPKIFASVQDLTFTPENIKSGFKKTGILPYDKSVIDSIWTNMSPETKSASGEATATGTESANAESASEATATGTESALEKKEEDEKTKAKEREDKKRKRQMEKENEEKDKEMEKEDEENEMDPQNEEDEREQNGKCQGDGSKRRRIKKRDSWYEYDF